MKPTTPLKLCSMAFALLWSGWMLWSGGSIDRASVVILGIIGALAGVAWYFAMRFVFRFIRLLPPADGKVAP